MSDSDKSFRPPALQIEDRLRVVEQRQERHRTEQRHTKTAVDKLDGKLEQVLDNQKELRGGIRVVAALFVALIVGVAGVLLDSAQNRKAWGEQVDEYVSHRQDHERIKEQELDDLRELNSVKRDVSQLKHKSHKHRWQR